MTRKPGDLPVSAASQPAFAEEDGCCSYGLLTSSARSWGLFFWEVVRLISSARSKNNTLSLRSLLVLLLVLLVSGCGRPAVTEAEQPFVVEDSYGRTLSLAKPPERIISLVPSHTEILFALGLGSRVIGVTDFCDYPEEAKQKQSVGGYANPSIEKIVSMKPDLVLAGEQHKSEVEQLEQLGINVVAYTVTSVREVPELIVKVGQATLVERAARELADEIISRIERVQSKTRDIPEEQRPLVYYEVWNDPVLSVGPGSFIDDLITLAGGRNLAFDATSAYPVLSLELIVKRDPDVILYAHGQQREIEIAERPGFGVVKAVATGRIIHFEDENIFVRSGPRIALALEQMAEVLHPDLFR